jgi:hypothetical protein
MVSLSIGIEPSGKNIELCREKYDIELFQGMFHEYRESRHDKMYDLVFLSHVLEHIVNPYQFISDISNMNNRYVFIDVPTFDYKFKDEPFGMFTDEHVNYFTFEGLNSLMKSLHYANIDVNIAFDSGTDVPSGCPCLVTLWQKQDPPGLTANKSAVMSSFHVLGECLGASEELQKEINVVIDGIQTDKLVVWGTGNTSSRLIANSGLRYKNIVKFYDSDFADFLTINGFINEKNYYYRCHRHDRFRLGWTGLRKRYENSMCRTKRFKAHRQYSQIRKSQVNFCRFIGICLFKYIRKI